MIRKEAKSNANHESRLVEYVMNSLIVLVSYHHNNTQKVAEVMAKVLDAQIKSPQQINSDELNQYDLVGFGSGIYIRKHHKDLLDSQKNFHMQITRKHSSSPPVPIPKRTQIPLTS